MKDEETDDLILIERNTTGTDGKYFFNLLPDKDYEFAMEGFQYFNEEIHLSTDFITFSDTFEMPPIWVNILTDKPIVLENIYYEFDKYELTEDAKGVLDTTLLELMQDAKNIVVEVSAHTDSVGNEEYNLSLSQQRAESVAEYIASKGIDPERLIPKGYGSSKPVAPNFLPDGSDNPEGREKNRRTEFRVVGTLTTVYQDEEFDDDY
jgi:outer membrane protein OmpA-like peptidoglycan-associated protein